MIALGRVHSILAQSAHHIDFLSPQPLSVSKHKDKQISSNYNFVGGPVKNKRYYATEEDDLDAPLKAGWKRETTIREYTKSGIRGEVVYVAPCGKRFKQYPDIIRVRNFPTAISQKYFRC